MKCEWISVYQQLIGLDKQQMSKAGYRHVIVTRKQRKEFQLVAYSPLVHVSKHTYSFMNKMLAWHFLVNTNTVAKIRNEIMPFEYID